MEGPLKRKVTSKLTYNASQDPSQGTSKSPPYRPPSPLKSYVSSTTSTVSARPKAKVNSSATPASARSKVSKSSNVSPPSVRAATSIPRPASPLKSTPSIGAPRIVRAVRSNLQPQSSQSTPGTPTTEYHRLDSLEFQSRPRFGSVSLRPGTSSSSALGLTNGSLSPESTFTPPVEIVHDFDSAPKIRSKVSKVAKHTGDTLSPSPPESGRARARADSVTSSPPFSSNFTSSSKADYPLYPITTASPAANPHRYTPNRPPPLNNHAYRAFSSSPPNDVTVSYSRIMTKIDPTTVPLPPHSPPTSAVSLSSRSSMSRSSVSFTDSGSTSTSGSVHYLTGATSKTSNSNTSAGRLDIRGTLDALVQINGMSPVEDKFSEQLTDDEEGEENAEERKVKDEAKTNRKIADLEITNRSLLAINSSLEATKHRQAKEIRELRRKLRESRLILPPRTFLAITSKEKKDEDTHDTHDTDDDPEEDEDDEALAGNDETYMRIRMRMDELIEAGKSALLTKPADFAGVKGGAKVLSEEEVRDWSFGRGADGETSLLEPDENAQNVQISRPSSRNDQRKGHDTEDLDELMSEDEVEAMTLPRHSASTSPSISPPPIVVTHST